MQILAFVHVGNIVISIVLIIIYICIFGQQYIKKYFDEGIIVLTHEEHIPITPPGKWK